MAVVCHRLLIVYKRKKKWNRVNMVNYGYVSIMHDGVAVDYYDENGLVLLLYVQ